MNINTMAWSDPAETLQSSNINTMAWSDPAETPVTAATFLLKSKYLPPLANRLAMANAKAIL